MDAPLGEYTPDLSDFEGGTGEALNVYVSEVGYRPMPALAAVSTTPLSARAQGVAYFKKTTGDPLLVAGDITKLYLLSTATWTDASRLVGGVYATAADDGWDFAQFGTLALTCNGTDTPQKFTIDSSTNFAALGGTPPTAPRYVEVMGDFVVFGRLAANKAKVQWSAINDAEDYVASATTQSDSQTLPDGGDIMGMVGFEYGGVIVQERAVRRMDYEGSPIIFRFKKVSNDIGASIAGSIAGYSDRVFFVHSSGFFMVVGGAAIVPIGAGKVDRYFWADVDQSYLTRITAAVDPVNKLYAILYCGVDTNSGGTPNRMLLFHWDTGRWSHAQPGSVELIWSGTSQTSITLDGLDAYAPSGSLDLLPASLDSSQWSGVPKPLFGGFDTTHNLGFFTGANLAATMETSEQEPIPGKVSFLRWLRPMVDGSATPSVSIGYRNRLQDVVSYGTAVATDDLGYCKFRQKGRYMRGRITLAAGESWDHALGIDDIKAMPMGRR